jgi:hypothetical protein
MLEYLIGVALPEVPLLRRRANAIESLPTGACEAFDCHCVAGLVHAKHWSWPTDTTENLIRALYRLNSLDDLYERVLYLLGTDGRIYNRHGKTEEFTYLLDFRVEGGELVVGAHALPD